MEKVRIVIDSTTDLSEKIKDKLTVVPLTVRFGEEEYIDGITMTHKDFYEKLTESDVIPATSQPTPEAFSKVFREITENGEKCVVLTLSSHLSGTFQSACIAASDHPGSVYVVDGRSVAIGTGILAELALNMSEEGKTAEEIVSSLEKERENVRVIAMLDTLEYLKRGGRISKTVAFAGGILSIKPVVSISDGEIIVLGKARGSRQGNDLLVKEIGNLGGVDLDKPFLLGYTGVNDELLRKFIETASSLWEERGVPAQSVPVGSVVGTHAGPGAVAAAFFKKN
ncbi:MAG: DegV family protein [Ruminococcaceae bacterium]|nr:DegV family protein [Oscillospiraceae bacterium]